MPRSSARRSRSRSPDPGPLDELTAVGALVSLRRAWRASPLTVSWRAALPGDCTELAAEAKRLLLALGWPPALLELWICKTELRQGRRRRHAVLIVRVPGGKPKAIDNRVRGGLVDQEILRYTDWRRMF